LSWVTFFLSLFVPADRRKKVAEAWFYFQTFLPLVRRYLDRKSQSMCSYMCKLCHSSPNAIFKHVYAKSRIGISHNLKINHVNIYTLLLLKLIIGFSLYGKVAGTMDVCPFRICHLPLQTWARQGNILCWITFPKMLNLFGSKLSSYSTSLKFQVAN
jgi:hypothetical protein